MEKSSTRSRNCACWLSALARPLQHHQATLLAGLQITGTRGRNDKQHRAWSSGNRYALPTSPHPRRRLLEIRNSCVTLTHPTAQRLGHSNWRRFGAPPASQFANRLAFCPTPQKGKISLCQSPVMARFCIWAMRLAMGSKASTKMSTVFFGTSDLFKTEVKCSRSATHLR